MNVEDPTGPIIVCREPARFSENWVSQKSAEQCSVPDPAYHDARERAERKAAKDAKSVRARRIHQELAEAHSRESRRTSWPRGH